MTMYSRFTSKLADNLHRATRFGRLVLDAAFRFKP